MGTAPKRPPAPARPSTPRPGATGDVPRGTSAAAAPDALAALDQVESVLARTERLATLGLLLAMVSHEYNNILTPVGSYARLALADPTDTALTVKALEQAAAGAERAAAVATAILDLARVGGVGECDVERVVEAAVRCLGREPAREGVMFHVEHCPGARAAIGGAELQQVLVNLLMNAMKAVGGRRGTRSVHVKIERVGAVEAPPGAVVGCSTWNIGTTPSSGWVVLRVRDNGPGVPEAVIKRVFEPLVRGGEGGTGLGLAVCVRLLERAGGGIWCQSAAGEGMEFAVVVRGA